MPAEVGPGVRATAKDKDTKLLPTSSVSSISVSISSSRGRLAPCDGKRDLRLLRARLLTLRQPHAASAREVMGLAEGSSRLLRARNGGSDVAVIDRFVPSRDSAMGLRR